MLAVHTESKAGHHFVLVIPVKKEDTSGAWHSSGGRGRVVSLTSSRNLETEAELPAATC